MCSILCVNGWEKRESDTGSQWHLTSAFVVTLLRKEARSPYIGPEMCDTLPACVRVRAAVASETKNTISYHILPFQHKTVTRVKTWAAPVSFRVSMRASLSTLLHRERDNNPPSASVGLGYDAKTLRLTVTTSNKFSATFLEPHFLKRRKELWSETIHVL